MKLVYSFEFRYTGQRPEDIPNIATHATVDPSVEEIRINAFAYHQSLRSIVLPSTLKRIRSSAFYQCKALAEIQLPSRLSSIEEMSFFRCESLRSVSIPPNVEAIDMLAFDHCSSLTDVHLPEGLKFIRQGAFSRCKALSAVALPSTLEEIGCNAFADCIRLLGVEIPKDTSMKIDCTSFLGCSALVNVSIPSSIKVEHGTFSGHLLEDENGSTTWLHGRYADLPLHEACYYSSVLTRTSLTNVLDNSANSLVVWEDGLHMTPFHVLVTSANLKVDILKCLLDRLPMEILFRKDRRGKKMLDYILTNTTRHNACDLVKTVFQKAVADEISTWSLGYKWGTKLSQLVQSIETTDDIQTRGNKPVEDFLSHVGQYTRLEMTSLVDLALWKLRMSQVKKEEGENDGYYRDCCHCQSGAEVVIMSVVGYLWPEQGAKSDTALSIFPLYSPINPDSWKYAFLMWDNTQ